MLLANNEMSADGSNYNSQMSNVIAKFHRDHQDTPSEHLWTLMTFQGRVSVANNKRSLAPGGTLSFGAATQPVHGSTDAKNEFMKKGRR